MRKYFVLLVGSTALGCLAIACLGALYLMFLVVTSPNAALEAWRSGGPSKYLSMLFNQNEKVSDTDADLSNVERTDANLRQWLRYCLTARQAKVDQYGNYEETALLAPERTLQTLAIAIFSEHIYYHNRAEKAYQFWEVMNITSIVLGLLTTVIVSLSTTVFSPAQGQSHIAWRVLAIVFPAVGTAVAAIIAFYSPQAEWSQASRTVANLTQLQRDMSIGIWKLECLQSATDTQHLKPFTDRVEDWAKRYGDIKAVQAAVTTTSSNSAPQGSGSQGAQGLGPAPGTGGKPQ